MSKKVRTYSRNGKGDVDELYAKTMDSGYSKSVVTNRITRPVSVEFTRENNATPYTAGDVISGSAASPLVYELPDAVSMLGGTGTIINAQVIFNVKQVTQSGLVKL